MEKVTKLGSSFNNFIVTNSRTDIANSIKFRQIFKQKLDTALKSANEVDDAMGNLTTNIQNLAL